MTVLILCFVSVPEKTSYISLTAYIFKQFLAFYGRDTEKIPIFSERPPQSQKKLFLVCDSVGKSECKRLLELDSGLTVWIFIYILLIGDHNRVVIDQIGCKSQ